MAFPSTSTRPRPDRFRNLRLLILVAAGATFLLLMISPRLAESLLFLPTRTDPGPASRIGETQGEDVTFHAADGVALHAWWFEAGPDAPAVLFLHGNAGTIGDRRFQAEGILQHGVSVFLPSYRGYGRSEGSPSEEGVGLDAEAALRWLAERAGGEERIVIHGRSLGGAVGGGLAARHPAIAGLILESTFTDLEDMAAAVYPFIPRLLLRRLRGRFDTKGAVSRVQAPILVIHGGADQLIPVEMGRTLHREGTGDVRFMEVPGAGHNDLPWVAGPLYFQEVAAFVRTVVSGGGGG